MEKMLEKIKIGFDPQKGFANMYKNRNMKDGIGGQMMNLNPLVMQKTSKEVRNREPEATKNMGVRNNGFILPFMWKRFSNRFPPMDYFLRLKKILLYKT